MPNPFNPDSLEKDPPIPPPGAAGIYLVDSFGNCDGPKGVGKNPAPWHKPLADFPEQVIYVGF